MADIDDLVNRMRAASAGHEEWRVQDQQDGAYCIAFSRTGHGGIQCLSPEREAREWLADQQRRFPNGRHAGFVVACVLVLTDSDRLLAEAADRIERAAADTARLDWLEQRGGLIGIKHLAYGYSLQYAGDGFQNLRQVVDEMVAGQAPEARKP